MRKKLVYISSPYRSRGDGSQKEHADDIALARRACQFALDAGCIPYDPHLFFPQFVSGKQEQELGLEAGLAMVELSDELWVFGNRISEEMSQEIALAARKKIPVVTVEDPRVAEEHLLDVLFGTEKEEMENEQD